MIVKKRDIDNLRILKGNYEDFSYLNDSAIEEMKGSISKVIAIVCQYIAEHPENLEN
ncbi:hypothetical protein ACAG96_04530 [Candidatus Izemoplasma sp. B36]|uniref:hypothetical protein n=1 Tax=Candidatus Izemoplasma sp. B36 TaxID=3242468 RepID=UPI0035565A4A